MNYDIHNPSEILVNDIITSGTTRMRVVETNVIGKPDYHVRDEDVTAGVRCMTYGRHSHERMVSYEWLLSRGDLFTVERPEKNLTPENIEAIRAEHADC